MKLMVYIDTVSTVAFVTWGYLSDEGQVSIACAVSSQLSWRRVSRKHDGEPNTTAVSHHNRKS